jgi:hypothetical protein
MAAGGWLRRIQLDFDGAIDYAICKHFTCVYDAQSRGREDEIERCEIRRDDS